MVQLVAQKERALGPELAERIVRAVDTAVPDALEFLADLIRARPTLGNESDAQAVFAAGMEQIGFEVEELAVPETIGEDLLAGVPQRPYAGRPDVLARTAPGDLRLLINGHIDVVPAEPDLWSFSPWAATERDGWVFGRGAGDMKGGFAMAWLALHALREACPEMHETPIGFLSVIEEECTGNGTLAALRAGIIADTVVLPEPTDLRVLLGGVGIVWADVRLTGGAGHAEAADRLDSVMDVVARLVPALADLGRTAAKTTDPALASIVEPYNVNIGTVEAGDWRSTVAGTASLGVRFAHPRAWSSDRALTEIETVVAACCERSSVSGTVTPSGFRAEGYVADSQSPVVAQIQSAHAEVHGEPCETFVIGSTTDARYYVNTAGVSAVCYGPVARRIHGADEAVEVASIVAGAKTLAMFLARHVISGADGTGDIRDVVADPRPMGGE
jgi:acetylornithine deacetylase